MMTAHHTGAVQVAETELRNGQSSDAKVLAQRIIDAHCAEITEMQGLLAALCDVTIRERPGGPSGPPGPPCPATPGGAGCQW